MPLDQVFRDGEREKRIFNIPEYQRGYSWEKQQRADLFRDIENIIKAGCSYMHYTGTIVVASDDDRQEQHEGYKTLDLVDGQQRITTLILLLSVVCRKLRTSSEQSEADDIYCEFIKDGSSGDPVFKLKLGQGLSSYFEELADMGLAGASDESAESKSHQNLKDAVKECQDWIEKQDDIDAVLSCVCEKLGFLVYAPKVDNEIGIMFEVINNRGKPLSELEKIKNYLIYFSQKNRQPRIREQVERYSWPKILENLNKADCTSNVEENSFLRNCWIVFRDPNKARSHHVYDNLKKGWPPDECTDDNVKDILEFIKFLKDSSINYRKYCTREDVTDDDEKSWLERIKCHQADASIMPLILAISNKVKDDRQNDKNDLFELVEKLNFRYYVTRIAGRADTGQGHLFWLAHRFYNSFGEEVEGEKIDIPWFKSELRKFINERAPDNMFRESFTLDKDYSYWGGLKFFLASYEQDLRKKENKKPILAEIMAPQSKNSNERDSFYHKEHFWAIAENRYDSSEKLDVNKLRLGNFMLLNQGLNIAVKDKRPEVKVEDYFNQLNKTPDLLMILEVKEFFDEARNEEKTKNWQKQSKNYWLNIYKRFFDMRERKMINFALERWRVPGLDDNVSKV